MNELRKYTDDGFGDTVVVNGVAMVVLVPQPRGAAPVGQVLTSNADWFHVASGASGTNLYDHCDPAFSTAAAGAVSGAGAWSGAGAGAGAGAGPGAGAGSGAGAKGCWPMVTASDRSKLALGVVR